MEAFETKMNSTMHYRLGYSNFLSAQTALGLNEGKFGAQVKASVKRARNGLSNYAMFYPFLEGFMTGDGCGGDRTFTPLRTHFTYVVSNTVYENVSETLDSNSCAYGGHHVYIYTAPHIGEIKIDVRKNPNGDHWDYGAASVWAPITWELVQYHIVQ